MLAARHTIQIGLLTESNSLYHEIACFRRPIRGSEVPSDRCAPFSERTTNLDRLHPCMCHESYHLMSIKSVWLVQSLRLALLTENQANIYVMRHASPTVIGRTATDEGHVPFESLPWKRVTCLLNICNEGPHARQIFQTGSNHR